MFLMKEKHDFGCPELQNKEKKNADVISSKRQIAVPRAELEKLERIASDRTRNNRCETCYVLIILTKKKRIMLMKLLIINQ